MAKINTYGLIEQDFKKCFLRTVTPIKMDCPKCKARVSKPCKNTIPKIVHTERIQALYDKCKRIKEDVLGEECEKEHYVEIY